MTSIVQPVSRTKFSQSAASRITGKSRTTIAKHIRARKLSVEKDADGNTLIDASELIRVYGDACDFSVEEGGKTSSKTRTSKSEPHQTDQREVDRLQAQLDRERQLYDDQIEHLKAALAKAQDGHNRATLLLEDQTKRGGGWEQALQNMEEKLANQRANEIASQREQAESEMQKLKDEAAKREERLKRALDAERKKPIWKKIWS